MPKLWRMRNTPSLPLLPGPLWPGKVAPDKMASQYASDTDTIIIIFIILNHKFFTPEFVDGLWEES